MSTTMAEKARPILFSAPMIQALLNGRTTITRRIVKPQPEPFCGGYRWDGHRPNSKYGACVTSEEGLNLWLPRCCPYGAPGDVLYVREALMAVKDTTIDPAETMPICAYRADGTHLWTRDAFRQPWRWQRATLPAIHMPRWASRITLRVTDVRVERLQAITEDEAEAEGLEASANYSARQHFARLWTEINGAGSWASDPWIWRVAFDREAMPCSSQP